MKFEVLSAVTWKPRKILQTLGFIHYPQQCELRDEKPSNFTKNGANSLNTAVAPRRTLLHRADVFIN
jgi:hypothetical protein